MNSSFIERSRQPTKSQVVKYAQDYNNGIYATMDEKDVLIAKAQVKLFSNNRNFYLENFQTNFVMDLLS
jgi:hypothetical protein